MKDIKVLKATPMFNGVITTCHQWEVDGESDGLIDTAKSQGVVKQQEIVGFDFPLIELNGEPHMLLNENDIVYIVNEYEEFEIESDSDLID